ncbi:MAG: patatin-like phospholipase family protein [Eubacteriales bacterium]|nr:patatin-like phospholipase family protein [Eubacteriales bacterium]
MKKHKRSKTGTIINNADKYTDEQSLYTSPEGSRAKGFGLALESSGAKGFGLALEGGGAKGAYHMGVIKAFLEKGYKFGGITGTSIGALNGAAVAQGDFDKAYRLWEKVEPSMLFDIDSEQYRKLVSRDIDKEAIMHFASQAKKIIENKGIDTNKIRSIIGGLINEDRLRRSRTDFGLVTVSVSDFKPVELFKEDIPAGKIIDYLLASANLPIFGLKKIENKYYIDGGFYDNCPINLIASKGYKDIIAVRTLAFGIVQDVKRKDLHVTNIKPSEPPGKVLDFSREQISRSLNMGYYDAIRNISGLTGYKYYIKPFIEKDAAAMLLRFNQKTIKGLMDITDPASSPSSPSDCTSRLLLETTLPRISHLLGLEEEAGYDTILIKLMEILAEEKGLQKYRIYSFRQFTRELKKLPPLPAHDTAKDNESHPQGGLQKMLLTYTSKKPHILAISQYVLDALY